MRKILFIMICFLVTYTFSILHINAYTIKSGTTVMTELYVLALLLLTTITGLTPP